MITNRDIIIVVIMIVVAIVVNMIMRPTEAFAASDSIEGLDSVVSMLNSGTVTTSNLHVTKDANIEGNISAGALNLLPKGIIVAWGSDTIPTGWALCDGNNGTPNLMGQFIYGANANRKLNTKGGAETVAITVAQMPAHSHNINTGSGEGCTNGDRVDVWDTCSGMITRSGIVNNTGSGQPHENMPPYTALNFIMKL